MTTLSEAAGRTHLECALNHFHDLAAKAGVSRTTVRDLRHLGEREAHEAMA